MTEYQTVVGLEVHIQMNSVTKAFCADSLSFGAPPNTHVSNISLAHPGTLPVANQKHVENGIKLALALGSKINQTNAFDRKHYYYADLPKAYQITQDRKPICEGGALEIELKDGSKKSVRIHHVHMEEDAGKTIHDQSDHYSMVDLNRAGTPLLELVTEPDLSSGDEVLSFIAKLQQLVRYLDISDGDMEKGSLRCDVNISVKPKDSKQLGERCEVKNVNSKKFAKIAVEYETKRQIALLEDGQSFTKQTLHFDPETNTTSPMRDKEDADDYRYFPDPDLPPIHISDVQLEEIKNQMVQLPWDVKDELMNSYGLNEYDSSFISREKDVADYFFRLTKSGSPAKPLANLMINKILPEFGDDNLSELPIPEKSIQEFINLISSNKINSSSAYQKLWPELVSSPSSSPENLAKKLKIIQIQDDSIIDRIVQEVLDENAAQADEYRNGKKKIFGFLVGQAMKKSKGAAPPDAVKTALINALKE